MSDVAVDEIKNLYDADRKHGGCASAAVSSLDLDLRAVSCAFLGHMPMPLASAEGIPKFGPKIPQLTDPISATLSRLE